LEIIDWWGKKIEELSKGMAQKVQFITTVLHEPKLLIFDEPFSGFDPVNANIIKNEILYLREKGATIIFSTHNMESVEALCDNITLLNKSKNILEGSVNEIRSKWASNEYGIIIEGDVTLENNAVYNVVGKNFEYGKSHIRIKTQDNVNTNDVLYNVMKQGTVLSFTEALPSMNEIFLRVVQSQE
jgi:ABC-2 type transport system ATP-binding protein